VTQSVNLLERDPDVLRGATQLDSDPSGALLDELDLGEVGRTSLVEPGASDEALDPAGVAQPSEWGSLVGDLSRGRGAPSFRIHDRTHIEVAVDYRPRSGRAEDSFVWETYYFAPESLRLHSRTYEKSDLYADLQSYVRFEVPDVALGALTGAALDHLGAALESGDEKRAMRELRLYACMVRAAGVEARDAIREGLAGGELARTEAHAHAAAMIDEVSRLNPALRARVARAGMLADPVRTGACWVEEDVSRLSETLLGSLVNLLRSARAPEALVERAESAAVAEARHRMEHGLGGVGRIGMGRRLLESLEFRRHVLKRFTASVLWLQPTIRPGSTWVLQSLYALAASVAMGFALLTATWSGFDAQSRGVTTWMFAAALAYAAKDRIKALLQSVFADVVSRHFPDRRWKILDRERDLAVGEMDEQSGFVAWTDVPREVLATRRITRLHPLEEQARPETVLFHRKQVALRVDAMTDVDPRFTALTEIFRLDLRRWLANTDDPKRQMVFADPVEGVVASVNAPRVYNIAVVYRLRRDDAPDDAWHRARIVVSRKGILRIEHLA
jgi:hypothetical protein